MASATQMISFHPSLCSSSRLYGGFLFTSAGFPLPSAQFPARIVSLSPPLAVVGPPLSFPRGGRSISPVKAVPSSPPSKSQEQKWVQEGLITESLPNGMFRVRLDNEQDQILGYICGKIRRSFIRILPGDRVRVEMSRYDSTKGRIIYRLRKNETQRN